MQISTNFYKHPPPSRCSIKYSLKCQSFVSRFLRVSKRRHIPSKILFKTDTTRMHVQFLNCWENGPKLTQIGQKLSPNDPYHRRCPRSPCCLHFNTQLIGFGSLFGRRSKLPLQQTARCHFPLFCETGNIDC